MEEQVDRLVKKVWEKYNTLPGSRRLLISICGIPGSGKTTLASTIAKEVNNLHRRDSPGLSSTSDAIAAFVPMDGYHLSRSQLDALPDPTTAHARRGAAFTFDGEKFLELVKKLREPLLPESRTLFAPSFDHAKKDPVADDISIAPSMRVVVFEGNYLGLDKEPWRSAAKMMDELWFVQVEEDVARARLIERHVKAGIARDREEAAKRADENDLVNGREIMENRLEVDEIVVSKEDAGWRSQE